MQNEIKNKKGYFVFGSILLSSVLVVSTALAAGPGLGRGMMKGRAPGVFGTVSSISGNILTLTSKGFGQNTTTTTYTIDATNATVTKAGVSSSVSNIAVGDMVMVAGTINGTSVVARTIRDGLTQTGKMNSSLTPVIKGNGQPIIGGNVTAISGSTLTVTNKSNITYTVDATNAVIEKSNAVSSVSNIVIGDSLVVQGTVSGTSVTATSVIDGGNTTATSGGKKSGFFGGIGNFFNNLFGFF